MGYLNRLVFIAVYCITFIILGNLVATTFAKPSIKDSTLKIVPVVEGLKSPTSMAFLGKDDILVLEKAGLVQRVIKNHIIYLPILNISEQVSSVGERGLLGIAVAPKDEDVHVKGDNLSNSKNIFLYYSEIINGDKTDHTSCRNNCENAKNALYKYHINGNEMKASKLITRIPSGVNYLGQEHIGGAITVGPDNEIYVPTGDGKTCNNFSNCRELMSEGLLNSQTANSMKGMEPIGYGGILHFPDYGVTNNQNGILGNKVPLSAYYAYGIRNSFGIDFDPVTGYLWDTENGPAFGDEINLVKPGFNSGWAKMQGVWPLTNYRQIAHDPPSGESKGYSSHSSRNLIDSMVDFNGRGKYSDPEFTWNKTIGVTSIKFLNSDKLGKQYENDMFVGSIAKDALFHFDLNANRTGLLLKGDLGDKVAGNGDELKDVIFAKGMGGITDLEVGPDGYLYVLSMIQGKIWSVVPANTVNN